MKSEVNLLVNDMSNTVGKNDVREQDLGAVDEDSRVVQDCELQLCALLRGDADVANGWREDDVVRDDMILQNIRQRRRVGASQHGANGLECGIGRDEKCEVCCRLARARWVGEAELRRNIGSFDGATVCFVALTRRKEQERGCKRDNLVNDMDYDSVAETEILRSTSARPLSDSAN